MLAASAQADLERNNQTELLESVIASEKSVSLDNNYYNLFMVLSKTEINSLCTLYNLAHVILPQKLILLFLYSELKLKLLNSNLEVLLFFLMILLLN